MKKTVCMAVFNGEKYLQKQLDSILPQLGSNDEIIIVDDQSTDGSFGLLQSYDDKRILLLKNEQNLGVVKTFEKAIGIAKGSIIFLSDQDDIWELDKVEKTLHIFEREDPLVVVSDAYLIDENGKRLEKSFFEHRNSGPGFFKNFYKNCFLGCAMAFKSEVQSFVLPFPDDLPMHDEWIGLLCSLKGKTIFDNEKLISYRRHDENVTNMHRNGWSMVVNKRLILSRLILKRMLSRSN